MARVLIVEDELALREDLVIFLDTKGYVTVGAATVAEANRHIENAHFDLIVLDIGLPDGNGLDLLRDIRARCGLDCGIVILTSQQELSTRLEALDAGSDAFLVKHASLREMEATLRNLLRRLPGSTATVAATANWVLDRPARLLISPGGESVPLTPREMSFLSCLAEAHGDVCDYAGLSAALDEGGDNVSTGGLNTLVHRLRQKMMDRLGQAPPIRAVYGKGYSFNGPVSIR